MLLLMAVVAVPAVIGAVRLNSAITALARVPLPRGGVVSLTHAGSNVIYYEQAGSAASAAYVPPISLHVTPASVGASVTDLTATGLGSSFSLGSQHGVTVFRILVVHPGRFRVWDADPAGSVAGAELAIGPGVPGASFVIGIVLTIVLGFILIGLYVVIVLRRTRRRFGALVNRPESGGTQ